MICLMTIKVDRKDLNEKDYSLDITNDNSKQPISPDQQHLKLSIRKQNIQKHVRIQCGFEHHFALA